MDKTVLSFYLDDTSPYVAGADAFKTFLDFVSAEGIAGESSVILGSGWEAHGILSRPTTEEQRRYIAQVRRAFDCGIDSQMELMTHGGLFDFGAGRVPEGAEHEGVWLYEPEVSLAAYESYFEHIIAEGERIGVRFTGVTWPGCGCEVCERRSQALREKGVMQVNPNVWQALLNLAKQGRFRGRTVPCFSLDGPLGSPLKRTASEGEFAIYDFYPNAEDQFGIWENNPARVNADYYISADGESGRIVELVRAGAPYCLFYAHWQGLNPATGVGWSAFVEVVHRIRKHLGERVAWMRPSAWTDLCHKGARL